mmetsp:Transcript_2346/g.7484  ORF Transcript_2346/g.7484 Transcript_2346/m.7484 type:complete len:253 (+) Transcript_2346:1362-2120(+)
MNCSHRRGRSSSLSRGCFSLELLLCGSLGTHPLHVSVTLCFSSSSLSSLFLSSGLLSSETSLCLGTSDSFLCSSFGGGSTLVGHASSLHLGQTRAFGSSLCFGSTLGGFFGGGTLGGGTLSFGLPGGSLCHQSGTFGLGLLAGLLLSLQTHRLALSIGDSGGRSTFLLFIIIIVVVLGCLLVATSWGDGYGTGLGFLTTTTTNGLTELTQCIQSLSTNLMVARTGQRAQGTDHTGLTHGFAKVWVGNNVVDG